MDAIIGASTNPAEVTYTFRPGRRSILAEVYFPRRIAAQGNIYNALKDGLELNAVKKYLIDKAPWIINELGAYPHWLDPKRFGDVNVYPNAIEAAKARFSMCGKVFCGWSLNEVAGAYVNEEKPRTPEGKLHLDEEQTQVIRLMFRFVDKDSEKEASDKGYPDIYRVILYWVLSAYGHADAYESWSQEECDRFLRDHAAWNRDPGRREFAKYLYPILAMRISKWIDDCGLFIFGYLVREFWLKIVDLHKREGIALEDEIWVLSSFHINVNIMTYKPDS